MSKGKKNILLAWGEDNFTGKLKKILEERGHVVAILKNGAPPKAKYNIIVHLGHNPVNLAEGTRDLLRKANKDKAHFFLVHFRTDGRLYNVASKFAKSLMEDFEEKHGTSTTILNLSRIYGPGVAKENSGALAHLIHEFSERDFLTLYAEGKDSDYYLFIDDALEGIAQALEISQPADIYAITSQVAITSGGISKLLYALGGGRHEIRYHRGLTSLKEKEKVEGIPLPNFTPKTAFRDGVLAVLKTEKGVEGVKTKRIKLPRLRVPTIKIKVRLRKPTKRKAIALGILVFMLSPILYFGTQAALAYYHSTKAIRAFKAFDLKNAQTASSSAAKSLGRLEILLPALKPATELASSAAEVIEAAEVLEVAMENLSKSFKGEEIVFQNQEDFDRLTRALKSAEEKEILAWIELKRLGNLWQNIASQAATALKEGITATRLVTAFSQKAWNILGYSGERKYLILFQNSAEARAGGGFLGSLARLTLKNGGIEDLEFFDSYQFDSAKRIPPHPAAAHFRNEKSHPLREANIWASFPKSAENISSIFEDARDEEIKGVLGTTLTFTKDLLAVSGEINLPEFERTVNSDNLFEVTTQEVEQDFFPGTTKKKRFLQALGEALIGKIFSLGKESYTDIARVTWKSLKEKNLLLYFEYGELAQELYAINFDGHVMPTKNDYLYVIDTNYATKVNEVWLERSVDYTVKNINREGTLQATVTITWTHTGTEAWPSGTYKNLLRVLVPKGSNLKEATLDDKKYLSKVLKIEESSKTEFAAYIRVEPQSTSTLQLTYLLPDSINTKNLTNYSLIVQKQPGTLGDSFSFTFEEPLDKSVESENLQRIDNSLIFKGRLVTDLDFIIKLKEK